MIFSVLDPEGKVQAKLDASTVRDACREWARQTSNDATVEDQVREAKIFKLTEEKLAARLEPYVVAPAGSEQEALRKNAELLSTDLHYRPEASLPDPRMVDTGGGD
ncbi:MAG: hypothetical protein KF760_07195 [Candidatus Eremiobacteraeota bacterium]|nr:hypothetical protein [Candidatus Eremiobacteraeota bacterium]MCW5869214.1 hypothetical protein [Candidatus Eremiobacteraeota bacterium]